MESPLVSVCIPAYNNADTILETIQSVLTQTYQNLELIVVDVNGRYLSGGEDFCKAGRGRSPASLSE